MIYLLYRLFMDDHGDIDGMIERSLNGDVNAYGYLVEFYSTRIRAFVVTRIGDYHAAQDLAQEVFLTAYRRLDSFDRERSFGSWLCGIAENHVRNYRKKKKEFLADSEEDLQFLVDTHVMEMEETLDGGGPVVEALKNCMDKINPDLRALLEKHYVQGFSLRDLCKTAERGYSAMTMTFHRVRISLKECIENRMGSMQEATA